MVAKLRQRGALLLLGRRNRRPLLGLLLFRDRSANFLLWPIAVRCHGARFCNFRGGRQYPLFCKK